MLRSREALAQRHGGQALALRLHLHDPLSISLALAAANKAFGPVEMLVHLVPGKLDRRGSGLDPCTAIVVEQMPVGGSVIYAVSGSEVLPSVPPARQDVKFFGLRVRDDDAPADVAIALANLCVESAVRGAGSYGVRSWRGPACDEPGLTPGAWADGSGDWRVSGADRRYGGAVSLWRLCEKLGVCVP